MVRITEILTDGKQPSKQATGKRAPGKPKAAKKPKAEKKAAEA